MSEVGNPIAGAPPGPPDAPGNSQFAHAEKVTKGFMLGALGIGLIPVPLIDAAALTALQLQLLSRLAKIYKVDFSSQRARAAIASLLGGAGSTLASLGTRRLLLKLVAPVPGWIVGTTSMSLLAGASTFALGRVFIMHFESGGTFLTFDPDRVRKFYTESLAHGREELEVSFAGIKP